MYLMSRQLEVVVGIPVRNNYVMNWTKQRIISFRDASGRNAFPNMIAWLSLVMLAAAWGPYFPGALRALWMNFGALGLASAVGLDVARRIRQSQRTQRCSRVVEQRVVKELTSLAARGAKAASIRVSLQRIAENHQHGATRSNERRSEPRIPVEIHAHLKPVDNVERRNPDQQPPMSVVITELSSKGIRLSHENRIDHGKVVVTFDLRAGRSMSLTAQLQWMQFQADGTYASGGTVLDLYPLPDHATKSIAKTPQERMAQPKPQEMAVK